MVNGRQISEVTPKKTCQKVSPRQKRRKKKLFSREVENPRKMLVQPLYFLDTPERPVMQKCHVQIELPSTTKSCENFSIESAASTPKAQKHAQSVLPHNARHTSPKDKKSYKKVQPPIMTVCKRKTWVLKQLVPLNRLRPPEVL